MPLITQLYEDQPNHWPASGKHILAQFDAHSIYVYQAYSPSIADYAVEHQRFGGEFSFSRMSWIKPNFLWMMYRSGWASKPGQECILAIQINRAFFDELLEVCVASTFPPHRTSRVRTGKRLSLRPTYGYSGILTTHQTADRSNAAHCSSVCGARLCDGTPNRKS